MNLKTVGVLGGLGPETTSHFYMDVVSLCKEKGFSERPPILIWSIPLPYNMEKEFIINGKGIELYLPFLIEGARKLEKAGADFLVIPCNSVHIFIEEIRGAVQIPVLSIVEETVSFLIEKNVNHVGLLATTVTIQHNLYASALEKKHIVMSVPDVEQQEKLNRLIQKLVQNGVSVTDQNTLLELIQVFADNGVKTVLLGCTDLQLLVSNHPTTFIYDTMRILVEATVREIC